MHDQQQTENQINTDAGSQQSRPDGDNPTTNYPEWVVVEKAGEDEQDVWTDHYTYAAALREMKRCGGRENGFDLMRRLSDGTLTTDF